MADALRPILNSLSASYNALKRRDKYSGLLSDYWVAWWVLSSRVKDVPINPEMAKYASKEARPKILKLINAVHSRQRRTAKRAVA